MIIQLSSNEWADHSTIDGCCVHRRDDDLYYVSWCTGSGIVTSEAHASKKEAQGYVNEIVSQINRLEKEANKDG